MSSSEKKIKNGNLFSTHTGQLHATNDRRDSTDAGSRECDITHRPGDLSGVNQKSFVFFNEITKILDAQSFFNFYSEKFEPRSGVPHHHCHLTIDRQAGRSLKAYDRLMNEREIHRDTRFNGKRINRGGWHFLVRNNERTDDH